MQKIIKQIEQHAKAAQTAPDAVNHLQAIIGACGILRNGIKAYNDQLATAKKLIEFTRDFHRGKAEQIDLNKTPSEKLLQAHFERDRLEYTANVLEEILKRIEAQETQV